VSLFISVYLDEDVDVVIAELLRSRGFTATTTVAAGRQGASDEEQLIFAAEQGHTLLTHNRADFDALASPRAP
jgi:hypothetical protein